MKRFQIENLYRINGLDDFRLKNPEDLLKTHGIHYKAVGGYDRLNDTNKMLYKQFIVNIYNAFSLESRAALVPRGIYYVEDIEYLVWENPEDDYYTIAGGVVHEIDKDGQKTVLHIWQDDNYKRHSMIESESRFYLRFEYEHQGQREWLHVESPTTWY